MSKYTVVDGDTFGIIARKQYGSETSSSVIASANPGVSEPLTAGTVISIPVIPSLPVDQQTPVAADNIDEVAIFINGVRFRFWGTVSITHTIDNMSTVQFTAPFEHDIPDFREKFRPMSFAPVTITIGGEVFFKGVMLTPDPVLGTKERTVSVSCYALPGVLNDCTSPASAFPLEFNEMGLQEIATALVAPFGLGVEFQADQGAPFERVANESVQSVLTFLITLAKQRNIIMSNTKDGKLLFWQSVNSGVPAAVLEQGSAPVTDVTPYFNPQQYYSDITGIESVEVGADGSQFTVKNPKLQGVVRPSTFVAPDVEGGDVKQAVDAKIGHMFGNMVTYSVSVSTWRTPKGDLWTPNTIIKLLAPGAMIYNAYDFVVRNVVFTTEGASRTAVLELVMPGAFSGQIPETLPWDG